MRKDSEAATASAAMAGEKVEELEGNVRHVGNVLGAMDEEYAADSKASTQSNVGPINLINLSEICQFSDRFQTDFRQIYEICGTYNDYEYPKALSEWVTNLRDGEEDIMALLR